MIEDRDPFAYAGKQENQDTEILARFHEWLDVCRILDATQDYEGDDEKESRYNAACDRQGEIEDCIFACRGGGVGLAVKAFLDIYRDTANWAPSASQVRVDDDHSRHPIWLESVLRDDAAIVPEIAECAAAVIHDDAVLIDAEMDAGWAMDRLAEPPSKFEPRDRQSNLRKKLRKALDCIANTPARTPRGEAIKAKHRAGGSAP